MNCVLFFSWIGCEIFHFSTLSLVFFFSLNHHHYSSCKRTNYTIYILKFDKVHWKLFNALIRTEWGNESRRGNHFFPKSIGFFFIISKRMDMRIDYIDNDWSPLWMFCYTNWHHLIYLLIRIQYFIRKKLSNFVQ